MSGQDLMNALQNSINLLNVAQREFGGRGRAWAAAERDYRIALSKKMLIERDNGMPVSILSDVCRGSEEVAELKFKRDCAKVNYESVQEAVNVYKLQIKVLENQIEREWRG